MSNHRWLILPFALCFSLCLMMSFAPYWSAVRTQTDFLMLWIIALIFIASPMLYLEIALAKRSDMTVIQALSRLTRDADAPTFWRAIGWLSALFTSFLAGGLLKLTLEQIPVINLENTVLLAVLIVVSVALSLLPRWILTGLLGLGILTTFFIDPMNINQLQWTAASVSEWGLAVMLALFSTGLGMGLYWQQTDTSVHSATPLMIPTLFTLIVAGIIYTVLPIHYHIANIVLAAMLLQFVRQQWLDRQFIKPFAWALSLSPMLIWFIPQTPALMTIAIIWGLLLCLVYSIFAGWIMKASHLRKSLNFSQEIFYNLWRVAVRIIVPVNILITLILMVRGL